MEGQITLDQIAVAEGRLEIELQRLELTVSQNVDSQRDSVRIELQDSIEGSPGQKIVVERIEHMRLRLELLRNIRMNWEAFQSSLTEKGMSMRINQDAHLRHLILFLETGQGIDFEDTPYISNEEQMRRDLMTYEVQPTGAGKTGAFAIDVALMNVPSLTLVPFDSLLDQTKADFEKIGGLSTSSIGLVGGGEKDIGKMHIIATYAGHAALLKSDPAYRRWIKEECRLVICDEVHYQALGDRVQESIHSIDEDEVDIIENEREALATLSESTASKSLKIGFTATPRTSRKHVSQYFPHCLGRLYYKEMIEAGLVVPYRIVHSDGSVVEGEYDNYLSQAEEAEILNREGVYGKLAKEYVEVLASYRQAKERHEEKVAPMRGMAFCTNHAECQKFADEAKGHGLRCRIVTGKEARGRTGRTVINEAVEALNRDEIDLIITVEKLATGFNRPEINAVVWARITSAAKTIQAIGRGGRSHIYPGGIIKSDCLVFETNWSLKGNMKKGRRPLRFADALAQNGEDPMAICSMADGSALDVNPTYALDEDGVVEIGGKLAISIYPYAASKEYSGIALKDWVTDAGLQPVPGVRVQNKNIPVDVYWKDEVDPLLPKRLDSGGVVEIDGRKAVGITAYANAGELVTSAALLGWITEAGLQKIPNVRVMSYRHHVDVYWKDEVDQFLPKKLDENGTVSINGRDAIGIYAYAQKKIPPIAPATLVQYVEKAKLQPIPNIEVMNNRTRVDVYWRDEIDALIPRKIDEAGIVSINGRDAVGINVYIKKKDLKIEARTLLDYIQEAGFQPVKDVTVSSGVTPVDVYWKSEIDSILPKRINQEGIIDIDGREAVCVILYAKSQNPKITPASLQKHINSAGIQPIQNQKILSGSRPVDIYWKNEVDALLPRRTNEHGVVDINGREAVSIYAYGRLGHKTIKSDVTLQKYIERANLRPVSNVWVITGGSREVEVYWKDEVDALSVDQ